MLVKIIQSDPRAREKPCLRCGLALRKLLDAKHCPNCGLSVWLSLNDNQNLDWCNPPWLTRLSLGAWIMAPAQLIALAAYAIAMLPYDAAKARYPLAAILAGAYLVIYHVSLLLMSQHENRYPDRLKTFRTANQVIAPLAILIGALLLIRGTINLKSGWPVEPTRTLATMPGNVDQEEMPELQSRMARRSSILPSFWLFLAEASMVASAVATFTYLRKLAQRIPNSTVARICGYILLAPLVSFLKVFPFFGFFLFASIAWVTQYLPIIYFPLSALLFIWFAVAFRRASINAAEGWEKETNPGAIISSASPPNAL